MPRLSSISRKILQLLTIFTFLYLQTTFPEVIDLEVGIFKVDVQLSLELSDNQSVTIATLLIRGGAAIDVQAVAVETVQVCDDSSCDGHISVSSFLTS